MKLQEFLEAIKRHDEWLKGLSSGVKLEFHGSLDVGVEVNLSSANLSSANLSYADLHSANLHSSNLSYANLHSANLSYANLHSANLHSANLSSADLSYADLSSADLDFSSGISLQCNSFGFKADMRLAAQLSYHFCKIDFGDCADAKEAQKFLAKLANQSHVIEIYHLPKIEVGK